MAEAQLKEYQSYSSSSSSDDISSDEQQGVAAQNPAPNQQQQQQPNENRLLIKTMLITLGFQEKYIERAIRSYEVLSFVISYPSIHKTKNNQMKSEIVWY